MAELDKDVKAEIENTIKSAMESARQVSESKQVEKYSGDEISKHQENCNDPDCPACKTMNEKVIGKEINVVEKRIDDLIEKKKFSEINKDKFNSCIDKSKKKCENKFATASRFQKLRLGIGKKISGSRF